MEINVCLTGCVHTKKDNPNLPITAGEIFDDVEKCYSLGAKTFHIHARDNNGKPTWHKETYQIIIDKIRAKYQDVKLCVSTSGRHWTELDKRMNCLDCHGIDMASLTLGSFNFLDSISINHPDTIRQLAVEMKKRNIKPELEIFEPGHLNFAKRLIKENILNPPYYFNLIFGCPWAMPFELDLYHYLLNNLPANSQCNIGGIGKFQQLAAGQAIQDGLGIRIGLEDNLYLNGELTTNEELLRQTCNFR